MLACDSTYGLITTLLPQLTGNWSGCTVIKVLIRKKGLAATKVENSHSQRCSQLWFLGSDFMSWVWTWWYPWWCFQIFFFFFVGKKCRIRCLGWQERSRCFGIDGPFIGKFQRWKCDLHGRAFSPTTTCESLRKEIMQQHSNLGVLIFERSAVTLAFLKVVWQFNFTFAY